MKKVLVIGAGVYQTTLIQRLKESGYYVLCVDKNPKAPGFALADEGRFLDVLDLDSCLAYARRSNIDAVMSYGATLTLATVSYIAAAMDLPALPMETAKIATSKFKIKERLSEGGCHIYGDFFAFHTPQELMKRRLQYPCVLKPSDGSGSKGVSLVYSEKELQNAAQYALENARYGEAYVEGLIRGAEYSVEAFVCDGKIYVYGIVKTTFVQRQGNDISYGHRTPSGLSEAQEEKIEREIKKAIQALNITMGSVNFDVILSEEDGNAYIIDCGIRIGQNLLASHLIPLSRGVSIIDNTIKLSLGEPVDAEPKTKKCVATRLLIYQPGIIEEIRDVKALIGTNHILDIVLRKGKGDRLPAYREKSDTCGWVLCSGNTPEDAESNAEAAKEMLREYFVIC